MNTQTKALGETVETQVMSPAEISARQRMYWLMRREFWENRSLYFAPVAIAGLTLLGFLISTVRLPAKMRAAAALGPMEAHKLIAQPYLIVGGVMMLTTVVVGIFYCLDALYAERRDRSILFWKSLPVSDLETVLSKAVTPVVILPLITFGVAVVTQWIMLLVSSAVLLASGLSIATLWAHATLFQTWFMLFYHLLTVHGLWYAPLYGWLLLVSAWARRAPLLWAALPPLVIAGVEKIAFNTTHFGAFIVSRILGGPGAGDDRFMASGVAMDPLMHYAPASFLSSPGLWIGLAVAAAFLVAAARLRRDRGTL